MTDTAGPFDGTPWAEAQWYRHAAMWTSSGVYGTPAASTTTGDLPLSVSALTVGLGAGRASVRGAGFERSGAAVMQAVAANTHTSFYRRDRIVLRRNLATHTVTPVLIQGTPAGTPAAPALTQSDAGSWDLPLFSFLVPPGSGTTISGILDERVWLTPSGRLMVATMANRPISSSGLVVGDVISAADRPSARYVWDGRVWVQEGIVSSVALAPDGSYVSRQEGTAVATTQPAGGFFAALAFPFSAVPLWAQVTAGSNESGLVDVGLVATNHTASQLSCQAFTTGGATLGGVPVRVTYTAVGYNT